MIVLGIVGILSAIAVPSFTQHRLDSFEKQKSTNIRMVQMAKEQWNLDNPGGDDSGLSVGDIASYLSSVELESDLDVNGYCITIGDLSTDPIY